MCLRYVGTYLSDYAVLRPSRRTAQIFTAARTSSCAFHGLLPWAIELVGTRGDTAFCSVNTVLTSESQVTLAGMRVREIKGVDRQWYKLYLKYFCYDDFPWQFTSLVTLVWCKLRKGREETRKQVNVGIAFIFPLFPRFPTASWW
jgi:hypothetical protein